MRTEYADLIARRLEVPVVEGPDKVLSLAEAVRRFISPAQTIYLGAAHGRPNALVRELVRQWWGKQPEWTLALTGFGSPWTALAVGASSGGSSRPSSGRAIRSRCRRRSSAPSC